MTTTKGGAIPQNPYTDETKLLVERTGTAIRVRIKGMTNHEMREVLIGLWASLDHDDKADHVKELDHYLNDPRAYLSPLADAISKARLDKDAVEH